MKRLPIVFLAVLLLTFFLVGCSDVPLAPPVAPSDQAAVDTAVAATLTAIVEVDSEESDSAPTPQTADTATPEVVAQATQPATGESDDVVSTDIILPPSVTDFDPAARPASSKGDPDAPVVIYEWSDYT